MRNKNLKDIELMLSIDNEICIGKDLLKCGYPLDYVWFLFDENSKYTKTLIEEGTTRNMRDEKGEPYPEIFYTTVEE
ncbi:hypothetical protein FDF26_13810 [Clostridium botulinum]|nr:hypothetical protein [Clostridium botulinum]